MSGVRLMPRIAIACLAALFCASCGPHMNDQPSIHPYERIAPRQPEGTVPTRGRIETISQQQSELARNPVRPTPVNLANGRIYYGYYCVQCHGDLGDGNGPVGISYVPKPADLRSPAVTSMSDGQIYAAMLHGVGHDPVMMQTVAPEQRWPIVLHLRTLAERDRGR